MTIWTIFSHLNSTVIIIKEIENLPLPLFSWKNWNLSLLLKSVKKCSNIPYLVTNNPNQSLKVLFSFIIKVFPLPKGRPYCIPLAYYYSFFFSSVREQKLPWRNFTKLGTLNRNTHGSTWLCLRNRTIFSNRVISPNTVYYCFQNLA